MHRFLLPGLLAALAVATATRLPAASVTPDPAADTVAVGATVRVDLVVAAAAPFANWGEVLRFDPAKLAVVSQAAGDRTTFIADSRALSAINASGEIRLGGWALADTGGGTLLASVTFRAIGGAGTDTTVTMSARAHGEPFGALLRTADAFTHVPTGGAATIGLLAGAGGERIVSITITGPAGPVTGLAPFIEPAAEAPATVGDGYRFTGLLPALPYILWVQVPVDN